MYVPVLQSLPYLILSSPGILCLAKLYLLPHCRQRSHDSHMTVVSVLVLTCSGILNVSDISKMSRVGYPETPHPMSMSPLLAGEGDGHSKR